MDATQEREYHITVRVCGEDLPLLAGLDLISAEEVTPGGWTRRLPDKQEESCSSVSS